MDALNEAIALVEKAHADKERKLSVRALSKISSLEVAAENLPRTVSPQASVFVALIATILHLRRNNLQAAAAVADGAVRQAAAINARSFDPISAKIFFYYARIHELQNSLPAIIPNLLASYRTATLRHDDETQATILNILLRYYLANNYIDQADKLVSKAPFPESASNSQAARYAYYLGRIRAIQLDYSASHRHLLMAIRKAPQTNLAAGFIQTVTKLSVIVQLLMGEIPERSLFREPKLRKALLPYLIITQSVRTGDLAKFQDALVKYANSFRTDKNISLILRLRHNVIKAGVRRISLSYSRISLRDICLKLQLDSEEDAEYIISKSIRDGVIDATLHHDQGYMKSNDHHDVYATTEPSQAYHQRIGFCLEIHNNSVKALRFPLNAHQKDVDQVNKELEEERKAVQEMVENGELDDDFDGADDMDDF